MADPNAQTRPDAVTLAEGSRDLEQRWYGDPAVLAKDYGPNIDPEIARLGVAGDYDDAELRQATEDAAVLLHHLGIPADSNAAAFLGELREALLSSPPVADRLAVREQVLLDARAKWGPAGTAQRLEAVQRYLAAHPASAHLLGDPDGKGLWLTRGAAALKLLERADRLPAGPRR